ncbi:hypothetical protein NPIL_537991 [Nephila pilipes]|uniref:Uncharacterized protein n=1 Tax=Nephila pilipes TaxID=299642 RepID=A0A8X6P244_NEPPI|nr:hypothetical protein NPIL_537991 [Nephila pilipes]
MLVRHLRARALLCASKQGTASLTKENHATDRLFAAIVNRDSRRTTFSSVIAAKKETSAFPIAFVSRCREAHQHANQLSVTGK